MGKEPERLSKHGFKLISTACWSHETQTRNTDTKATSVHLLDMIFKELV